MGWACKYEQKMLELPELAIVKDITTLGLMTPRLEILFLEPLRSGAVGEILVMEGQGCCQRRGGRAGLGCLWQSPSGRQLC